jgi:fructose-bisphosphate aldolase class II
MPLVSMRQLLDEAAKGGYGVGAFNVNDMEQIQAIMAAARETKSPVIVQASRGARQFAEDLYLFPAYPGGRRTQSRHSDRHAPGSWQQL